MTPRRSKFIVISDDDNVVHVCRTVAEQTERFEPIQRVLQPALMPTGVDLDDWVVVDREYCSPNHDAWRTQLEDLAAQILIVGQNSHGHQWDTYSSSRARFVSKDKFDSKLSQLFGVGGAPRTLTDESGLAQTDEIHSDLIVAQRLGAFSEAVATLDRRQIARACAKRLAPWAQARQVDLYEIDEAQDGLRRIGGSRTWDDSGRVDVDGPDHLPLVRAGRCLQVVLQGRQGGTYTLFDGHRSGAGQENHCAEGRIIAPLATTKGLVGMLGLCDPTCASGFSPQFLGLLGTLRRIIAVALGNAREFRDLQQQARTDGLTGLPNRRTFAAQLGREVTRARRYGAALSLVIIDMDGLKSVNDTYGHPAGDAVLCEAAKRIARTVRESDMPARYGGDEFAVILPNTDLEQGRHLADRLTAAMAESPCRWQGNDIPASFSVGLCECGSQPTAAKFVQAADAALYEAKSRGRNCTSTTVG